MIYHIWSPIKNKYLDAKVTQPPSSLSISYCYNIVFIIFLCLLFFSHHFPFFPHRSHSTTGTCEEPCKDGGLLFDHVLQPQDVFCEQKDGQRWYYRTPAELPHLRRAEHTNQHISVWPAWPRRVPGFLPTKPHIRIQTVIRHVYVLPWVSDQQVGHGYRVRPARLDRPIQKTRRTARRALITGYTHHCCIISILYIITRLCVYTYAYACMY